MENIRRYFYELMTDRNTTLSSCLLKSILWVLSLIYGFILWMREISYRIGIIKSQTFPEAKIISVGNITLGGTGKTPMVIKLASFLEEKGRRVAVLLRGYGQDEYAMLKNSLGNIPVIRGKNRIKSGRAVLDKYRVDTLILDDGFQYKRLKKDFNVILVDSKNPFGNKHLLPRGILREKISNLKYADAIVLTKTEQDISSLAPIKERLKIISNGAEIYQTHHKPFGLYDIISNAEFPFSFLKDRKIASLSSIGDPQYFNNLLEKLGAEIILKFSFLDHYDYKENDIDRIISSCKRHGLDTLLTTQKDAVKLAAFSINNTVKIISLKVRIEFRDNEDHFFSRLFGIYSS